MVCAIGGHLGHGLRIDHRHAFLQHVAHALAAVEPGLLGQRSRVAHDARFTATEAGP
jgi:hypothetical protein